MLELAQPFERTATRPSRPLHGASGRGPGMAGGSTYPQHPLGRELINSLGMTCESRFAPKADKSLRRSEMTRRAGAVVPLSSKQHR